MSFIFFSGKNLTPFDLWEQCMVVLALLHYTPSWVASSDTTNLRNSQHSELSWSSFRDSANILTPIFVSRLRSTKKSTVFASKPMTNTVFLKICIYKMFNSWNIKFLFMSFLAWSFILTNLNYIRQVFFGSCFFNVMVYNSPKPRVMLSKQVPNLWYWHSFCQFQDHGFHLNSKTTLFTIPWNFYLENSTIATFYSRNSTMQICDVIKVVDVRNTFSLVS